MLFSAIFLLSAPGHFTRGAIQMAAEHGVPLANVFVPLSGVIALLGGLSILLGYHARIGGLLIVLFLVPVTLKMHDFWAYDNPQERMMQQINFMKNMAMCGGAVLLAHFGAGAYSLDARIATGGVRPLPA